jgi:hypothetical protein
MKKLINIICYSCFIHQASFPQLPIDITLRVQQREEAVAYKNEPVLFTISLVNKEAQSIERWNMAADRQLKRLETDIKQGKISRQQFDKEKQRMENEKKKPTAVTVGSREQPWPSLVVWTAENKVTREKSILPV